MAEIRYIGKDGESDREKKDREKTRLQESRKTEEQIQRTTTQRLQGQLILAKARHELIPKEVVQAQAAFLFVALRQKIMQLPQTYSRRSLGITEIGKARQLWREAALALLSELEDLPDKLTDPDFLKKIDADGKDKS